MTKAEAQTLARIRAHNDEGRLAWLGTSPDDPNFAFPDSRWLKRLFEAGLVVWFPHTPEYGSGWAIREIAQRFRARFISSPTGS